MSGSGSSGRASGLRASNGRGEGAQAMAEYAIIAAALMGGLAVMTFQILPDFIEALQVYLNGFYLMLNLPIP